MTTCISLHDNFNLFSTVARSWLRAFVGVFPPRQRLHLQCFAHPTAALKSHVRKGNLIRQSCPLESKQDSCVVQACLGSCGKGRSPPPRRPSWVQKTLQLSCALSDAMCRGSQRHVRERGSATMIVCPKTIFHNPPAPHKLRFNTQIGFRAIPSKTNS
jgi:hypothetical protein